MEDKRIEQKRESWIKNVIKVQGLEREEAEKLYDKIRPFDKVEVLKDLNDRVVLLKNGIVMEGKVNMSASNRG